MDSDSGGAGTVEGKIMDSERADSSCYYLQDGESKGPIEQSQFEHLVREGAIGADTLVWQEGLAGWQPYEELVAHAQLAAPSPVAPGLFQVPCSRCGQAFQADELVHVGGVAVCPACKPLALRALKEAVHLKGGAEQLRKAHLSREASVQQIGFLYVLMGVVFALAGLFLVCSGKSEGLLLGVVALGSAALQIAIGMGLNKLRPWSRIAAGLVSGYFLLPGFLRLISVLPQRAAGQEPPLEPFRIVFHVFVLYLLFSKKGSTVFSEPYRRAVAATPHIKYRLPILVLIAFGFIFFIYLLSFLGTPSHRAR